MEDFSAEVAQLKKGVARPFKGCFLAGGAVTSLFTNRKIRDYGIYFKNQESFCDAVRWMYDDGCRCVAITPRAITFIDNNETVYQLMSFSWFETANAIFEKFDFSCIMAAVDLETGEFFRHRDFIRDVAKRRIAFNPSTEFPIGSALRVRKYQNRGYNMDDSEFLKVMLPCAFKKINTWEELKNQIGGQYGEAVAMDTLAEFTLENAIKSLSETLIQKPRLEGVQGAGSEDEALKTIFGDVEKLAA